MNGLKIWSIVLAVTGSTSLAFAADSHTKRGPAVAVPPPSGWSAYYGGQSGRYKATPPAAAPVPSDWSGFYVGVEGGYGWSNEPLNPNFRSFGGAGNTENFPKILDARPATPAAPKFRAPDFGTMHQQGALVGGFAGAQKQVGNWVLGVEGDVDGANIRGSAVQHDEIRTSFPGLYR